LIVLMFCPTHTLTRNSHIWDTVCDRYIMTQTDFGGSPLQGRDGPSNAGLNYFLLIRLLDTVLQCCNLFTITNL
jgi:hypothetical protein